MDCLKNYALIAAVFCIIAGNTALAVTPICNVNNGLQLLNQPNPPLTEIADILAQCDAITPEDVQVLLLHGLLARKEGLKTKNYQAAIKWLQQAQRVAAADNPTPALELAVTYEWAQQSDRAKAIYAKILTTDPKSRPALLGMARVELAKNDTVNAKKIFSAFLQENPKDIDSLNGLARSDMLSKNYAAAQKNFEQVLQLDPNNADAKIGLTQLKAAREQAIQVAVSTQAKLAAPQTKPAQPPKQMTNTTVITACPVNTGLTLINQPNPPYDQIKQILAECDRKSPHDVQVLLLHGLTARKIAMPTQQYQEAIMWFQQAAQVAAPNNPAPELELAVTYEWSGLPEKAQAIYAQILLQDPNSHAALLGMARTEAAMFHMKEAKSIYLGLLQKNPFDVDALNGIAWLKFANKDFSGAKKDFLQVQDFKPDDADARAGLAQLKNATKYRLDYFQGQASVGGLTANTYNMQFYSDLNATDQLIIFLTHNSKEIQLGFITDPPLLPSNSALIGFQRQIPNKGGWGVSYDYRERQNLPVENRFNANANIYLIPQLQIFGGAFEGLPSPWNNQLYYSGLMAITPLPVNFSFTGFWGHQEVGQTYSSAYSFDVSKEFLNRAFYDLGVAYSPSQENWNVHGRLVVPTFKNQAVEAGYDHYFFNNSTYAALGWRIYW